MLCPNDETPLIPANLKYRCTTCKAEFDLKNAAVNKTHIHEQQLENLRKKIVDRMVERSAAMQSKKASKTQLESMNGMINRLLSRYQQVLQGK